MPFPTINTAHIQEGLERLVEQYKESPNLQAWLSSYLKQIQDLENATWEVIEERFLPNAVGHQLDVLGKLVQLGREGLSDALYRGAINVQIRINRSFGTQVDMLDVARLALGPTYPKIIYQEFYPAAIKITLDQAITDDERFVLYRSLYGTKAAGVRLLVEETFGVDNAFTFNDAAGTLGNDGALAFGSVHGVLAPSPGVLSHIRGLTSPTP